MHCTFHPTANHDFAYSVKPHFFPNLTFLIMVNMPINDTLQHDSFLTTFDSAYTVSLQSWPLRWHALLHTMPTLLRTNNPLK
jgi:hypothetical protein